MPTDINIAIVDDQVNFRNMLLYSLLNAGENYDIHGMRFKSVDASPFISHEDQPFSPPKEHIFQIPEFLVEEGDYKNPEGYILDPSSPYNLHVGGDGGDAVDFAAGGLDLLIINRQMIKLDGNRAINHIRKTNSSLPIIIVTSDDEGMLTQLSSSVYTQQYGDNMPNVNGYVSKKWGWDKRTDALGVQSLVLLFPDKYSKLIKEHEKIHGPIFASNLTELIERAEMDKSQNPTYYSR